MKTKQMAYDAILTAMCVVLGLVSLDFGNLKITFEDLPILLGAALFGPWDGMIIGVLGTSIYQMLRFGADPTSLIIYSHIYGFFTPAYILAPLLPRFLIAIAKGSVYANVMPPVIRAIRKTLNISIKKTA